MHYGECSWIQSNTLFLRLSGRFSFGIGSMANMNAIVRQLESMQRFKLFRGVGRGTGANRKRRTVSLSARKKMAAAQGGAGAKVKAGKKWLHKYKDGRNTPPLHCITPQSSCQATGRRSHAGESTGHPLGSAEKGKAGTATSKGCATF
jgi:hypothetical protein